MPAGYQEHHDVRPPQEQARQPGCEHEMEPQPIIIREGYKGADRLRDKVALITGGDSGIGRSIAVHFAREGAQVAIVYLEEDADARETARMVRDEGADCLLLSGDVSDPDACAGALSAAHQHFGRLDILVNNAAEQHPTGNLLEISNEQLHRTFATNMFAHFYFVKAALPLLRSGGVIINTTSVVAYRGSGHLMDYAASKGAVLGFTRSLAKALLNDGIRVNAVAPGPIWAPLIPATFDADKVEQFGEDKPMGRAGQPAEVAPAFVFLASDDASYMVGQVLHPNGGDFTSS